MKKNISSSIAVVGAGNWGENLIRNFFELGVLKAICDKSQVSLTKMRKLYPDCDLIYSLKDVLARKDIPAIVIATPAETHYGLTRESLLAGKHVFVEKPLTLPKKMPENLFL